MATNLQFIKSATASGGVSTLDISNCFSAKYDVYELFIPKVDTASNFYPSFRFLKASDGTADTTANYDSAAKNLKSYGAFGNYSQTNSTYWDRVIANFQVTTSGVSGNAIIYLYNFNSSSEYSFVTLDDATMYSSGLLGQQGGGVHTVASASDGIQFFFSSGNIDSGKFTLYGLKK